MSKASFDIIPMVAIHPGGITLYSQVQWSPRKPRKPKFEHLIKSDKKHNGIVSNSARRKVSKAIGYLLFMANDKLLPGTAHGRGYKFKIAFVTLTLPSKQIHSDVIVKDKLLNQMLIEMRYYYGVRNYVWRAEKQANGNIHFHILIDKFVPWSELRDRWNRITNKLGYVDRYREEMKKFHAGGVKIRKELLKSWSYKQQIKAYQAGKANDWNSPNSTDIHSLIKIHRVKEYVLKYCTKDEKNGEINGRMWGCNFELSDIPGAQVIAHDSIKDEIRKLDASKPGMKYEGDYFTVLHFNIQEVYDFGCIELYKLFCQFMIDHFDFNVSTVLKNVS